MGQMSPQIRILDLSIFLSGGVEGEHLPEFLAIALQVVGTWNLR